MVERSRTLVEPEDGATPYVQVESYLQLKLADGTIDFIPLFQDKEPYEGLQGRIKGLEPIQWVGEVR